MYNRTLSEVEIREVAKCHENKRAKSCENTITFSTSAPRTSYSSVWGGDKAGQGYGRGRLNSKAAWCAANSKVGEWMQMDTGSLQSIVGITTQGRRDSSDWVTGFKVQVSIDGMAWTDGTFSLALSLWLSPFLLSDSSARTCARALSLVISPTLFLYF